MKESSSITNLPSDILTDKRSADAGIHIHYYHAPVGSFRGKSMMTMNAVSLVIEGEKTMHFAEKAVHVNDREIHFLSAGNCIASMKFSTHATIKSILLFFDNKTLADFYLKYDNVIRSIKGKHQPTEYYVSIKKDAFIDNYINSLQLLINSRIPLSAEMKALKFEELILHLLHTQPSLLLAFRSLKKEEYDDIELRKIVEANIIGNISVDELAFLCNMSLSTFKRRFASIYGTSPSKWMITRRIEYAKDLLQHHGEKPADVYYKVGYENHSSFTQAFRQITGITPTQYQAQKLNVVQ